MREFDRGPLQDYTPCRFAAAAEQARALAVVHAELILIHPFRDGNGRCARLLAMLMGLQAGLPALNFSGVRGEEKRRYIAAIHAGMERNYRPMTAVFERIVTRTLRVTRPSQARVRRTLPFDLTRTSEARLAVVRAVFLNGERMPSIADELATDWYTESCRTAGSRI